MVEAEGVLLGGRYRLHEELGRGGMSTVHRASDEALGRTVAVKVFSHGLTDAEGLARHREEVQLLASLNHPGLVILFDAATDEQADRSYIVMELVEGNDLRTRLDAGPVPPAELAVAGRQLAEALAYTHARGVIHRDVKPGNILLPRRGNEHTGAPAKLADFGIARLVDSDRITATGTVVGTAGYFSPEQALGQSLTGASDIYSLGLVLLEALTGERAFPGSAAESMAARVNRDPVIPPSVDPGWASLLSHMTARDAAKRPAGLEVAETLSMLAAQPDKPAEPAEPAGSAPTDRTEAYEPTMRYPVGETQPLAAPASAESSAVTASDRDVTSVNGDRDTRTESATSARDRARRLRRPLIIAAIVAALVVVVTALALWLQSAGEPPAAPDYPAVEGELGESLEQLQRSVTP